MGITIKATGIILTGAIRSYVEKKIGVLMEHHMRDQETVHAEIEVGKISAHHQSGDIFRAEIMLTVSGRKLRAVSEKDDLYAAIDDMKDKIEREITHHKEKRLTLRKKGGKIAKKLLKKSQ